MELGDAELRNIFRNDLRIRFQRGDSVSRRQGVELAFPNRAGDFFEFFGRDFPESRREMPCQDRNVLGIGAQRLAEIDSS